MSKKEVWVLVPVKVVVFDEEVSGITTPSPEEVSQALNDVGFWENQNRAKAALMFGLGASPPCLDKIIK